MAEKIEKKLKEWKKGVPSSLKTAKVMQKHLGTLEKAFKDRDAKTYASAVDSLVACAKSEKKGASDKKTAALLDDMEKTCTLDKDKRLKTVDKSTDP